MKVKNIGTNNFIIHANNRQVVIEPDMVVDISHKDWEKLSEYPTLQSEVNFFNNPPKQINAQSKDKNSKTPKQINVQSKDKNSSGS